MSSVRLPLTSSLVVLAALPWAAAEDNPTTPPAPSLEERLDGLDQQVRILQRQAELAKDEAAAQGKTTAVPPAGESGFSLSTPDKSFTLTFGALVQADGRFRLNDKTADWAATSNNWGPFQNTLTMAKVRPQLSGTIHEWIDYRVLTEFTDGAGTALDPQDHKAEQFLLTRVSLSF